MSRRVSGRQKAGVTLAARRRSKHLHGVVGCAASRRGDARDEPRQPQPPRVDAKAPRIVIAKQFAGELGDAVNGGRPLDGHLRRAPARRRRSECGDRTWEKQLAAKLTRRFEQIIGRAHVDGPCLLRSFLGDRGEERGEVINHADVAPAHDLEDLARLHAVETFVIATRCKRPTRRGAQVRRDDAISAIMCTQDGDQFDSNLTERAGDQNSSHMHHPTAPLPPPPRRRRHATQLWLFALSPISLRSVFIR